MRPTAPSFLSAFSMASCASLMLIHTIQLLLLSTVLVDIAVHSNNYVTGIVRGAEGLRFSMPDFVDDSNITIVTEGGWYTNNGYGGAFVNRSGVVVLNELTRTSRMGRMVYHTPVNLLHPITKTTISFSTSFKFQIVTSNLTQCGSGLVFAVTPFLQSPVNSSGDRLGLVNDSTYNDTLPFFALEFDTYFNLASSYTSDTSDSHVAIDVGNLFSARIADTWLIPSLNLYSNYTFSCWMDYNSSTHLIRVWMSNSTSPQRPAVPLLEFRYDLSLVTTESMYIGFTGCNYGCGSGDQSSAIFSWDFDSDLDGDLLLSADAAAPQVISADSDSGRLSSREIVFLVLICVLALSIVIIAAMVATYVLRRRKRRKVNKEGDLEILDLQPVETMDSVTSGSSEGPQIFRYTDVLVATGKFAKENKIGEGLSSNVYKGVMPGGRAAVAVKRLKEGLRKQDDFFAEMVLINKMKHPNLMQLKGWCYHESGEALLIYDYMRNGSLESYLFGNRRGSSSRVPAADEGKVRMRILMEVAAALDYLHSGMNQAQSVLHRDVKAGNVLLTDEMEAKLADFGLARLVDQNRSVAMTTAMGTMGYVAPEVLTRAKITDRVDVFSFGVLMLEVACGRRAITFIRTGDGVEEETMSLHVVTWVGEIWESGMGLVECIDRRIPAQDWDAWERVVKVGMACCSQAPADRPNMHEVYAILQQIYYSLPHSSNFTLKPSGELPIPN